jgi:hypothetical protein
MSDNNDNNDIDEVRYWDLSQIESDHGVVMSIFRAIAIVHYIFH